MDNEKDTHDCHTHIALVRKDLEYVRRDLDAHITQTKEELSSCKKSVEEASRPYQGIKSFIWLSGAGTALGAFVALTKHLNKLL
jgi:hypothetical protein